MFGGFKGEPKGKRVHHLAGPPKRHTPNCHLRSGDLRDPVLGPTPSGFWGLSVRLASAPEAIFRGGKGRWPKKDPTKSRWCPRVAFKKRRRSRPQTPGYQICETKVGVPSPLQGGRVLLHNFLGPRKSKTPPKRINQGFSV